MSKDLFVKNEFVSHSGLSLSWKIECDALTDEDISTIAAHIASHVRFGRVIGIPKGGLRLAAALKEHESDGPVLIVDDVLTTGRSMQDMRDKLRMDFPEGTEFLGVVIFARGECLDWAMPVFQLLIGPK